MLQETNAQKLKKSRNTIFVLPSARPKPRGGLQRTEIDGGRCTQCSQELSLAHCADNYLIPTVHHDELLLWGLHHIWLVPGHHWQPVNTSLLGISASKKSRRNLNLPSLTKFRFWERGQNIRKYVSTPAFLLIFPSSLFHWGSQTARNKIKGGGKKGQNTQVP